VKTTLIGFLGGILTVLVTTMGAQASIPDPTNDFVRVAKLKPAQVVNEIQKVKTVVRVTLQPLPRPILKEEEESLSKLNMSINWGNSESPISAEHVTFRRPHSGSHDAYTYPLLTVRPRSWGGINIPQGSFNSRMDSIPLDIGGRKEDMIGFSFRWNFGR
jgi:hypothetical protein